MHRRSLFATLASGLAVRPAWAGAGARLVFSWPSNAGPLDPHGYSPNQLYAQAMVYEPLVRYAEGGRIEPGLATAWRPEEGGRAWVFSLRPGVRFSDGTAFDAGAVVANVRAVLANRARHGWLELAALLDGAEAVDAGTVRLRLREPYPPMLAELSLIRPLRFASPAVLRPGGGVSAAVGTGPWRLVESVPGRHDLFKRNEGYWGERPALDSVLVRVLGDANTRALALETGEIDLAYGPDQLDADTFKRFAADPRFRTAVSAPLATRLLAVNSGRFPTDELAVRRAVARAVDRGALAKHVLGGTEPVAEALFADNLPGTALRLRAPELDRAGAVAELESAGWVLPPGGRVRERGGRALGFELCFEGTDALQKSLAEAVQADLARVGIAVRLVGEDAGTVAGRQKSGEFGMVFGDTWGAPYDPHAFLASMRQPAHADFQAQSGLPMKAEIDRRIGEVLSAPDEDVRTAAIRWVLTTLHEQMVYFPVSFVTSKVVQRMGTVPVPFGATRYEIPFDR